MLKRISQVLSDAIFAEVNATKLITVLCILFVGLFLIKLIMNCLEKRSGEKINTPKKTLLYFSWVYFCGLLYITLFNRDSGVRVGIRMQIDFGSINGSETEKKELWYSLFNILLFVPAGLILPWLVKTGKYAHKYLLSIISCFFVTVAIETAQLLTRKGYFELTDIVCNFIGAVVGASVAVIIEKQTQKGDICDGKN